MLMILVATMLVNHKSQILISTHSLVANMSINQFSRFYIMAVIAVIVLTVIAISSTPAAVAQNMTDGNMTGGNMTGQTSSSSEDVEAQCSLSPACITWNHRLAYRCLNNFCFIEIDSFHETTPKKSIDTAIFWWQVKLWQVTSYEFQWLALSNSVLYFIN